MPVVQFEKRITLGNVVSAIMAISAVTAGYVALSNKVDTVIKVTETVPYIEDRVSAVESRATYSAEQIARLDNAIKEQDELQTKILLSLERIQEKLGIPPR